MWGVGAGVAITVSEGDGVRDDNAGIRGRKCYSVLIYRVMPWGHYPGYNAWSHNAAPRAAARGSISHGSTALRRCIIQVVMQLDIRLGRDDFRWCLAHAPFPRGRAAISLQARRGVHREYATHIILITKFKWIDARSAGRRGTWSPNIGLVVSCRFPPLFSRYRPRHFGFISQCVPA